MCLWLGLWIVSGVKVLSIIFIPYSTIIGLVIKIIRLVALTVTRIKKARVGYDLECLCVPLRLV
jgi:hypothetical protein